MTKVYNVMEKNGLGATVVRTAIITLCVVFAFFSYGIALFGEIAPAVMADLCDNLGARGGSAMYYEKIYQRDKTPENLYLALDKFAQNENSKKVIEYTEMFFDLDEDVWKDIINSVDRYSEQRAVTREDYALGCNEYNNIKCNYLQALIEVGRGARAVQEFKEYLNDGYFGLPRPVYAFFVLEQYGIGGEVLGAFRGYLDTFIINFDNAGLTGNEEIKPLCFIATAVNYFGNAVPAGYNQYTERYINCEYEK